MRIFASLLLFVLAGCSPVPSVRAQEAQVGELADFLLVDKSERTLWVYQGSDVIRTYRGLQFGDAPIGRKRFEDDGRTPEGRYTIDNRSPDSSLLHIDYPNAADSDFARSQGRSPGGFIFIHGQPIGVPDGVRIPGDWTDGSIALSNAEIAELSSLVPDGTPIEIRP